MSHTNEEVILEAMLTDRINEFVAKEIAQKIARFPEESRRDVAEFMSSEIKRLPQERDGDFLLEFVRGGVSQFASKTPERIKQLIAQIKPEPNPQRNQVKLQEILTLRVGTLHTERIMSSLMEQDICFPEKSRKERRESVAEYLLYEIEQVPKEKESLLLTHIVGGTLNSLSSKSHEQVKETIARVKPDAHPKPTPKPKNKIVQRVISVAKKVQKLARKVLGISAPNSQEKGVKTLRKRAGALGRSR